MPTYYRTNLELDLHLVYEERAGDIIFLIGTILAMVSTYQAEQSILDKLFVNKSSDNSAYTIATASWLFLIASIVFTHVSIVRMVELKNDYKLDTSYSTIKAIEIVAGGNIIKSIGFALAAIGSQIRVSSLSKTTSIAQ